MLDLTIIIVNWNTCDHLKVCLESIYTETKGITFEVFVVDNASLDGSPQMVQQEFPTVKLIQNVRNVGFAKANNQAIAISKGRYVLLLNPDTIVLDKALVKMMRFLDNDSGIGALGCKILTVNGKVDFRCARQFPSIWSEFFEKTRLAANFPYSRFFGGYLMSYWDHRSDKEVDLLLGACMMVRRETIGKVGMMDEDFYMYGDDVEWCYRINKAGWRIFYYSGAEIIHIGGQSSGSANMAIGIEALRSMNLFFKKHRGHVYAWIHRTLMFFITIGKQLVFLMRYFAVPSTEQRRWYREKIKSHGPVLRWIIVG